MVINVCQASSSDEDNSSREVADSDFSDSDHSGKDSNNCDTSSTTSDDDDTDWEGEDEEVEVEEEQEEWVEVEEVVEDTEVTEDREEDGEEDVGEAEGGEGEEDGDGSVEYQTRRKEQLLKEAKAFLERPMYDGSPVNGMDYIESLLGLRARMHRTFNDTMLLATLLRDSKGFPPGNTVPLKMSEQCKADTRKFHFIVDYLVSSEGGEPRSYAVCPG